MADLVNDVLGLGTGGRVLYVDPANGSNSHSLRPQHGRGQRRTSSAAGNTIDTAFDTVTMALSKAVSGNQDVIRLVGNGQSTGSSRDTATLAWDKHATHLVGDPVPAWFSQRSRIAPTATFTPLMTVSADGCVFAYTQFYQGHNAASICVAVTGNRNYFYRCHIAGIAHATAAAAAGSRSLTIATGGENVFEECVIGLDTVSRTAAVDEIAFLTGTPRNIFRRCLIVSHASSVQTQHFVAAALAASADRFQLFEDCVFHNAGLHSGGLAMSEAIDAHAACGGTILLKNCTLLGVTDWETAQSGVVYLDGAAATAASSGLAVVAAPS